MKIGKYSKSSILLGGALTIPLHPLATAMLSEVKASPSHFTTLLRAGSTSITLALSSPLFPLAFVAFTFEYGWKQLPATNRLAPNSSQAMELVGVDEESYWIVASGGAVVSTAVHQDKLGVFVFKFEEA
jgi:hypothetical protein